MTCGIYKITERETERCYIGQSINIEERWKQHRGKRGKFPVSTFDYEVLVTCPVADLNELEILMIATFDSHRNGFNKTIGGTDIKSTHPDAETRAKIGAAATGRPSPNKGKPPSNKGKKASEETRRKMSEAKKGKGKPKSQCPHCSGLFTAAMMVRWHGNNCKLKGNN